MARFGAFLVPAFLVVGCGGGLKTSHLSGVAADDAVTAKLRETFTAANAPSEKDFGDLSIAAGWDCLYHATMTDLVFRGFADLNYHTTFSPTGVLLHEHAEDVHSGDIAFDPWESNYAVTTAGLRTDGHEVSRVIRMTQDDDLVVEWSYKAQAGDERGDASIADPTRHTVGYSTCALGHGR